MGKLRAIGAVVVLVLGAVWQGADIIGRVETVSTALATIEKPDAGTQLVEWLAKTPPIAPFIVMLLALAVLVVPWERFFGPSPRGLGFAAIKSGAVIRDPGDAALPRTALEFENVELRRQVDALKTERDDRVLAEAIAPTNLLEEAKREAEIAGLRERLDPSNTPTSIRIQFNVGGAMPTAVSLVNIWRWYILGSVRQDITDPKNPKNIFVGWQLFIVFDKPVRFKQILVRGHGAPLPTNEVRDPNERSAIVLLHGDSPGLVLDVIVDV